VTTTTPTVTTSKPGDNDADRYRQACHDTDRYRQACHDTGVTSKPVTTGNPATTTTTTTTAKPVTPATTAAKKCTVVNGQQVCK